MLSASRMRSPIEPTAWLSERYPSAAEGGGCFSDSWPPKGWSARPASQRLNNALAVPSRR
jgi:hypothetical protein